MRGAQSAAREFVTGLNAIPGSRVVWVRINSNGGDLGAGLAIYNALQNHPAKILVDIDGYALSAASLVAMAGEKSSWPKTEC